MWTSVKFECWEMLVFRVKTLDWNVLGKRKATFQSQKMWLWPGPNFSFEIYKMLFLSQHMHSWKFTKQYISFSLQPHFICDLCWKLQNVHFTGFQCLNSYPNNYLDQFIWSFCVVWRVLLWTYEEISQFPSKPFKWTHFKRNLLNSCLIWNFENSQQILILWCPNEPIQTGQPTQQERVWELGPGKVCEGVLRLPLKFYQIWASV